MEGLNRPILDNTYRLEPKECDRFYPSKVRECIEEIVTKYLADKEVYEHKQAKDLAEKLALSGIQVETGQFGAHMLVSLTNDGPVTFLLAV